ncbi:MAG TPA: hypothetical protein VMH26_16225 [Burkholderiales bacterium]|nr:hypothetical protein [Burkholderiales bacterium]
MSPCVTASHLCLLLVCALALTRAAAQDNGPDAAPDYQDRLIDDGKLAPDVSQDMYGGNNPEGWPRAFRAQLSAGRVTRNDAATNETGLVLGGMLDTPNYGAFTIDANFRASNSDAYGSGTLFTLSQRALPMNGGWFGNNALGVFNTPSTDLARQQYRFYMPTIPTLGAATEWRRNGDLQLNASVGEPGLYTGIFVPTFESLGGRVATGGLQYRFSNEWAAAAQVAAVNDVALGTGPSASLGTTSARSLYAGTGWGTANARAQLNFVDSAIEDGSNQTGVWFDAGGRTERVYHSFGAFYLSPNLVWGNQPLPSNIEGAYYRADFQTRRWMIDGGLDYVAPVSGPGSATLYAVGNVRYQYLTGLGIGGGANVLEGATNAWSAFGYVDYANPWGIGRAQINYATDSQQDSTQLTIDQSWNPGAGTNLSTSLLLGHLDSGGASANSVGVAVFGTLPLGGRLTLSANARWTKAFGDLPSENVLANLALNWGFAPGWMASLNYYESRNTGQIPLVVTSPIPTLTPVFVQQLNDRTVFLALRYEWRGGTPSVPLSGAAGGGFGSIAGVLYLDANDNSRLDAGEQGAANVTIVLDGRFSARTDAQGRFEFPAVGPGEHVIAVVPDNLPLPWSVAGDGRVNVQVRVRDQTQVDIPVRQLR